MDFTLGNAMYYMNYEASMEFWSCVGFFAVGAVVAFLFFAYAVPLVYKIWKRADEQIRFVFLLGLVVAAMHGGAKYTGSITFPRTDPEIAYLTDNGSYVTNHNVHVSFTKNLIVPTSANIFVDGLELQYTNQSDWAEHSVNAYSNKLFNITNNQFDAPFPNATNYNWIVYTDWVPAPIVHTNGVAYVGWQIGANKSINTLMALRTGIYADGKRMAPNPAITNAPAIITFTLTPTNTTENADEE